ncbi:MAG: DUF4350 domain-containing protein, partial [Candidatus Hydrogenedentales bacterium]
MRNKAPALLALALFAVFVFAAYQLLALQYATGAGYPPYSTLSATPLGMKAFYDGLERLPNIEVNRRLQSLESLGDGAGTTLVIAGAALTPDPKRIVDKLNHFIVTGGRVVVAYMTVTTTSEMELAELEGDVEEMERLEEVEEQANRDRRPTDRDRRRSDVNEEQERDKPDLPPFAQVVSVEQAWGFDFGIRKTHTAGKEFDTAVRVPEREDLPRTLPWIATLVFKNLAPPWQRVYLCDYAPVIVERDFGDGSIAMLADTYLLTNEGLRDNRAPGL